MILIELIGRVLDEKYRIDKQLGQGGMGAVYLATHLGTKRPVAVKVITPQFMAHSEFVERFRREAEAAGRLRHPNVVNVTDFGFAQFNNQRLAYLVMEYLDGCTLGEVLAEEKKLPLNFVVDIVEQVCAAVEEAHQQGIIHRDLKPDNIWLEPNGRGGYTVKVLDFGLAKLGDNIGETPLPRMIDAPPRDEKFMEAATNVQLPASGLSNSAFDQDETATNVQLSNQLDEDETATNVQLGRNTNPDNDDEGATCVQPANSTQHDAGRARTNALTQAGAILGTPIYMSPEQCEGRHLDGRTDIYSLGVIVYEMLTGEPPFSGGMVELMLKHRTATPTPLREKRKDISKKIAELIMSSLAKNPAERPASAASFASAMRARSEGASVLLRQTISLYSDHFPTFLRIAIISFIPALIGLIVLGLFGGTKDSGGYNINNNYVAAKRAARSDKPNSDKPNNAQPTNEQPNKDEQAEQKAEQNDPAGKDDKDKDEAASTNKDGQVYKRGVLTINVGKDVPAGKKPKNIREAIALLPLREIAIAIVLMIFLMATNILSGTIFFLAFVPVTVQLALFPLRQVKVRPIFRTLYHRRWEILKIMFHFYWRVIAWFCCLVIPGIMAMMDYLLVYPIVMMEGLNGRDALKRSKELVKRARGTARLILVLHFVIPIVAGSLGDTWGRAFAHANSNSMALIALSKIIANLIGVVPVILISPISAVTLALLYFNTRQAGGESLRDTLGEWEEDMPTTKWQQRMQERLRLRSRATAASATAGISSAAASAGNK